MTAPVHVPLPVPALATLTGRSLTPGYCPACLDHWTRDLTRQALMHPACRALIQAIHDAPPAGLDTEQAA